MASALTNPIPTDQKVRIIFKGFLVTQIKPENDLAKIGALATTVSTCHQPKIHIYKIIPPADDPPKLPDDGQSIEIKFPLDLNKNFSLEVSPTPTKGIKVFPPDDGDFNRHDDSHHSKQDFRWFTNLEAIHEQPLKPIEDKLKPMFTINKALFHTNARSDGEARLKRKGSERVVHFAKFATEITARVYLDGSEQAAFLNGSDTIFSVTAGDNFRYDIIYDCSCLVNDDEEKSDFSLIYEVITKDNGDPLPLDEQLEIEKDDQCVSFSPEVYCVGGNLSR